MIAVLYGIYTHGPHVPCVFPLTCSIELTHRCNLRCNHCYMGEIQSSAEMDNETLRDLIKDVADAGFVAVCLSGGEPLLRDDLQRIMCEIKKYDMDVILSTNGLLLSEECVQELKSLVDLVCISLDSHEEEIHDSFRGLNGSQKMTLQGINNCISQDVQVRIFTTLTKFNHKKLPELIRFVERMGINEIAFFDLNPVGKGKKGGRKDQLTVEELKEAVTLLNKKKESSRLKIDVLAPLNFYEKSSYINQMTLLSGGFCNAGISTVNISPDGIVQPCSRLRINLGNIKESKLQSIWKNSTVLKEIRDRSRLKGVCGECEHKYFCGGCRANAYSRYGDFLMEDMRCS
jgi:radical SAM protein with 4Fe4S-binding SPASM domain